MTCAMESDTPPRRKLGRPSKGKRKPTMVYLPIAFWEQVAAEAARDGLPVTAVVTRAVAEHLGEPTPADCTPVKHADTQTELPLTKAS